MTLKPPALSLYPLTFRRHSIPIIWIKLQLLTCLGTCCHTDNSSRNAIECLTQRTEQSPIFIHAAKRSAYCGWSELCSVIRWGWGLYGHLSSTYAWWPTHEGCWLLDKTKVYFNEIASVIVMRGYMDKQCGSCVVCCFSESATMEKPFVYQWTPSILATLNAIRCVNSELDVAVTKSSFSAINIASSIWSLVLSLGNLFQHLTVTWQIGWCNFWSDISKLVLFSFHFTFR